jgi:hypothetical protein
MRVQLKTDRHIDAHDELAHQVETVMEGTVGRFADQITRVEVHLSDENSHKGGGDGQTLHAGGPSRGPPAHCRGPSGGDPTTGDRWRCQEVGKGPREYSGAARQQEGASLLRGKPDELSRPDVNWGGGYLR